jgi:uncharacterized membrane protein SirB2
MSTTLLYALIMAIAQIVVTLISYFLGYQTDHISSGKWFQFVPLLVSIVVLILGIKAVREEQPGKGLSYGKGVWTGVQITFFSCIIGSIYAFIHFTYVNPNFPDYAIEAARADWAAKGMTGTQMEGAEKFTHWLFKPTVQSIAGFVLGNIFGVILSLIIAAFLKREPTETVSVSA